MAGNQRHRQHQFVFDQFTQIELGRLDQQVFGRVIILRVGRIFIGHKPEPAVHCNRGGDQLQAALAGQRQDRIDQQVQQDLRRIVGAASQLAGRRP